ncbi:MAG: lipid A biosynthesis acyltransferase [Zoogloeaceae bacterium]|nr:lipid A biosynthesis acyltransferase [Zoogloeaceae bacterium]
MRALRDLPSHGLVGLLWLLHWLPLPILAGLGAGLGQLLYWLMASRRHVVAVNLRLCFPGRNEADRQRLARAHFRALGRSVLERGLLWWAPESRLRRLIRISGHERVRGILADGGAVIFLTPHFVGLDMGGTRVAMEFNCVSIYAPQRNKVIDRWLLSGRKRFGDQLLLARNDSIRSSVKAMTSGRPFYYLPDMDQRGKNSIFAPFFGVPASTITGLSRFAKMADARVIPCLTRMLPGGRGYQVELGEPWGDFPSEDLDADVGRMNAAIEGYILSMPEQYYWVHKRFKTRPPGVPPRY